MALPSNTPDVRTALSDAACAFARRLGMFPPGAPVVALVSGGADSTALLRLLADGVFGESLSLGVLHVNHLLRGEDSDADESFVQSLCSDLGVSFVAVRYDVAAYAAGEGLNLEDAGRRVRYRFAEEELDARCDQAGASRESGRIAVAHTLDDRIETFFMRALTGAGSGGLASIAPVRGRIVRPLLDASRDDVRTWLGALGQTWREDSTNADTRRLRALIRHELVPVAESVNPRFRETLARSLDVLAEDDRLLSEMADAFARDFADIDLSAGEVAFDRDCMQTLSRPMARRTVRSALLVAFPEASRLEHSHVEALVDGLTRDGFARDLPGGLRAFAEYGRMIVARTGDESRCVAPGLLTLPGTVHLGDAGSITAADARSGDVSGSPDSVVIDATRLSEALVVDGVREGDRMRPFGMEGNRKLSDLLVDEKVPRRERANTPVVRDGERIVWLAGVRMSEHYRVTSETQRAIRLTWRRREDGA